MSLVPNFIYCQNKQWYENLIYQSANEDWFICFDDDEPNELVMKKSCTLRPHQILLLLGIKFKNLKQNHYCSQRDFSRKATKMEFAPAVAFFFEDLGLPFPAPRDCDTWDKAYKTKPTGQGVYQGFKGASNGKV